VSKEIVRPTLEQLKAAMQWWHSLGPINPPPETLKAVRDALNLRPGQGMGASDIARYWLAHIQPNLSLEQPKEDEHEHRDDSGPASGL